MKLDEIRTGIRTLPSFGLQDVLEITQSMANHFNEDSSVSDAFLDFIGAIDKAIEAESNDTRPADESWKARQDSALFQAYPGFGAAFDALDNLRIRGAI